MHFDKWNAIFLKFYLIFQIPDHVEVNLPTFEKEDLRRLIKSTTKDLEEADK